MLDLNEIRKHYDLVSITWTKDLGLMGMTSLGTPIMLYEQKFGQAEEYTKVQDQKKAEEYTKVQDQKKAEEYTKAFNDALLPELKPNNIFANAFVPKMHAIGKTPDGMIYGPTTLANCLTQLGKHGDKIYELNDKEESKVVYYYNAVFDSWVKV
jgi:hypothetical protein